MRSEGESPPLERDWWEAGLRVAGVDEAGRGAWAGPVVVAAVILPRGEHPFRDSKTLSARQREALEARVKAVALGWGVGLAAVDEIERLGILKATHRAAQRALECLAVLPDALITDYLRLEREWRGPASLLRCPPKADRDSPTVAAASILAKVARDRHMLELEAQYPGYGFATHKGYGTTLHRENLIRLGPSPVHRKTFAPVRCLLRADEKRAFNWD
ncbi:Ribonuclease H [Allomeiothermus silvanus DSM 9946]|uniref:Ribonuclease HII n=1 Tax=Allomeiothermus silvanus (strain ATCC 700542 / DSM 9946 / NBRC 106475 / NCIMB 13440 / VI-R2) TaxID=526227 RepID=D7B9V3_ALLS1|nr:ribonuclease HII [Allomeiothermus silvanus]ADH62387.1 Ribonuclease H [Allomeiothermus silvanus DSM 9946]